MALSGGLPARASDLASAAAATDFSSLSIDELANIDVSSVSKADQPLSEAAAAIFVITHDDIIRSGAKRLPDMLRLAPNLQVAQVTAASFAITARGFNGTAAGKLLVLIDGRSIYTPFLSGVFWDMHDVPSETIERIEVISGPGATLWGANAVNGVINIITRNSKDTQGGVLNVSGGRRERRASLQYGATLGEALTYRLYAQTADHDHNVTASGLNARDGWRQSQAGFRIDWAPGRDLLTLQGDVYDGSQQQVRGNTQVVTGHNLTARWTRQLDQGASLQVQAYYDYFERRKPGVYGDFLHTYDLEVQHSFSLGAAHDIVWGGGYRRTEDRFPIVPDNISQPGVIQFFSPESRSLDFANLFAQDTIALSPALKLTVGLKLEHEPYSGLEPLPSARLSWKASETTLFWAAVSRAVRAPTRFDRDFYQRGPQDILPESFQPEELVAYELGYRGQPTARSSLSVSAFYNVYDKLRTFERPGGRGRPVLIGNGMEGETYGIEAWGAYQVRDWWRLSAGANWMRKDLRFKPDSSGVGGLQTAGNDPKYQASIRSSMALPKGGSLDLQLRRVGSLPAPASPAYTELNGRVGWALTDSLELSITGFNLLHDHHPEFGEIRSRVQQGASGVETARSVVVDVTWRFGS
ncbi:TonB-dependent receptor [Phenylobacterium sp. LjRoot225]|uniref:TonB-dependent receptor plug domain-containing protein n=1 Tax=Phenylobacterium sp. LjRoot225 TaxID=3342285 RepID=UPI003ED0C60D